MKILSCNLYRGLQGRRLGFTMVEVMIAVGVMLVSVLAALSSQATSSNLIQTSRETDLAMGDLQACMEQILTLTTDDIPVAGSLYEEGQPITQYANLNLEGEVMVATYPGFVQGLSVPDPLEIVLTVTWQDYGRRTRNLILRSVKVQ